MSRKLVILCYLAAAASGIFYAFVLAEFFGQFAHVNPVNLWLIENVARAGHDVVYSALISVHDLLVYILIALPLAWMLAVLPPRNSWRYIAIFVATSFVLVVFLISNATNNCVDRCRCIADICCVRDQKEYERI